MLEAQDILRPDDWIRPLSITYHDSGLYDASRGFGNVSKHRDHLKFAPLWLDLGKVWWGQPVASYLEVADRYGGVELMRGDLPDNSRMQTSHWDYEHPLWWTSTREEQMTLQLVTVEFGKYKGRCLGWIQHHDGNYFSWLTEILPMAERLKNLSEQRFAHYSDPDIWYKLATYPDRLPWPKFRVESIKLTPPNT